MSAFPARTHSPKLCKGANLVPVTMLQARPHAINFKRFWNLARDRPKAVKDQYRVTAMRGGTETHGHLLYDNGHTKRENDEGDEEPNSKPRARRGVGNHTWAVVLPKHHENSGANK